MATRPASRRTASDSSLIARWTFLVWLSRVAMNDTGSPLAMRSTAASNAGNDALPPGSRA